MAYANCAGAGKLFGGCRFEARYDIGAPDLSGFAKLSCGADVLDKLRPKTYIRDVCVRCGAVIERPAAALGKEQP